MPFTVAPAFPAPSMLRLGVGRRTSAQPSHGQGRIEYTTLEPSIIHPTALGRREQGCVLVGLLEPSQDLAHRVHEVLGDRLRTVGLGSLRAILDVLLRP